MIVVDATVLSPALADDGADGDRARSRLRGEALAAPELIDLEVSSVFRRLLRAGQLPVRRAQMALSDLVALPLRRGSQRPLLSRCWDLRENLTCYDAAYVALAEVLGVTLVTSGLRLSPAPGIRCEVQVLSENRRIACGSSPEARPQLFVVLGEVGGDPVEREVTENGARRLSFQQELERLLDDRRTVDSGEPEVVDECYRRDSLMTVGT